MSTHETKKSILHRIDARPEFAIVPDHARMLFDRVMAETEMEALANWPKDEQVWDRVQFWKDEILSKVSPALRGLVAVQFHEYVAVTMRNDESPVVPSYGGEARAQRDAYMACCASLD